MTAQPKLVETEAATTELVVQSKPALLNANFDAVTERLERELEKYDVLVTVDTLADAKKLATELNKTATEFKTRRKVVVDEVSAPIKDFEAKVKELVDKCLAGRQKLLDQIKKFEDKTRDQAENLLAEHLVLLNEEHGVHPENQTAEYHDLIKVTAVTAKGNLTKAVKDTLAQRVRDDKAVQDRTDKRLLMLENASYKAGLKAPLTRAHVETFLFVDDATYEQRLNTMMQSELQREKVAEEKMRESIQKENDAKAAQEAKEKAAAEAITQTAAVQAEPVAQPEPAAESGLSEADKLRQRAEEISNAANYTDDPSAYRREKAEAAELMRQANALEAQQAKPAVQSEAPAHCSTAPEGAGVRAGSLGAKPSIDLIVGVFGQPDTHRKATATLEHGAEYAKAMTAEQSNTVYAMWVNSTTNSPAALFLNGQTYLMEA